MSGVALIKQVIANYKNKKCYRRQGHSRRAQVCGAICAVGTGLGLQAAPAFLAPFLAAGLQAALSNTSSAGMTACVDLFPTSIRSSAVSLTNMFGRMGSLAGNIVFPMLLNTTCSTSFYALAGVMALSCIIGFSLPVPRKDRNVSVDFGNLEPRPEARKSILIPPQVMRMRAASFNGVPLTIVSLDSVNRFLPEDDEEEESIAQESAEDAEATISASASLATLSTQLDKEEGSLHTSNQTLHM